MDIGSSIRLDVLAPWFLVFGAGYRVLTAKATWRSWVILGIVLAKNLSCVIFAVCLTSRLGKTSIVLKSSFKIATPHA